MVEKIHRGIGPNLDIPAPDVGTNDQVMAISDSNGAIFDEGGLDLDAVCKHRENGERISTYPNARKITNEDLLKLSCDYLVPAAMGNVIDANMAGEIKAGVVVEAANSLTTFEGDKVLADRGIPVLPDILANAGGVIVSYFEWVQNMEQMPWEKDKITEQLITKLSKASDEVFAVATGKECSCRQATYLIATQRLRDAVATVTI